MVFFSVGVHSFTNNIYEESHREDGTNEQVLKKSSTCICGHGFAQRGYFIGGTALDKKDRKRNLRRFL